MPRRLASGRGRSRGAPCLAGALALLVPVLAGCGSAGGPEQTTTVAINATDGAQATLTVGPLPGSLIGLHRFFTKHTSVFGVDLVATADTPDDKLVHAATVMAQYLDNDEDGVPDDPAVVSKMVDSRAILLMGTTSAALEASGLFESDALNGLGGQDLYADETAPPDGFDAALEEVHHLILNQGWARVFSDRLGQSAGSDLADAMDVARGGHFEDVPESYPRGAWYTYDDRTCDYACMLTEYAYWAHTSLLGAQADRCQSIAEEWRPCTAERVGATDAAVETLLTDRDLGLPIVLPDGSYRD